MSENGSLLSVATNDVVELPPSDSKRLFDGIDRTCNVLGDVKELCAAATGHDHLDGETNGCDGLESCDTFYVDSGISNCADMDICSIDDSEANGESCTLCEENQTVCATKQEETFDAYVEDTRINNVPNSLCSESKMSIDGAAETVLNHDPSDGRCTIYDGNCNIDTSAECSNDTNIYDINNDDVLTANAADGSAQSIQHSTAGDDSALDIKVNQSTSYIDVSEISFNKADEDVDSCPRCPEVALADVENLPADKSSNEGNAVEASEMAAFTTSSTSQLQSQPTFTSSRSVPRPARQNRPRVESYSSSPLSATPSSSCPDDDSSKQQYVVNVHVNPGETFSVCVSDQVQLIQGNVVVVSQCGSQCIVNVLSDCYMLQQLHDLSRLQNFLLAWFTI